MRGQALLESDLEPIVRKKFEQLYAKLVALDYPNFPKKIQASVGDR
jgi:hypothetical protein